MVQLSLSACDCVCLCVCRLGSVGPTVALATVATVAVVVDVMVSSASVSAEMAMEGRCAQWQPVWLWLPVCVSVFCGLCPLHLSLCGPALCVSA